MWVTTPAANAPEIPERTRLEDPAWHCPTAPVSRRRRDAPLPRACWDLSERTRGKVGDYVAELRLTPGRGVCVVKTAGPATGRSVRGPEILHDAVAALMPAASVHAGTVLSGALYQWQGLQTCLWASSVFIVAAGVLSRLLPAAKTHRPAGMAVAAG